jgi:Arc/MetJ-type ribon-helix-helix transcriptional regulator
MKLTLRPETERLLEEKLALGKYDNADDLLRAALSALTEQEALSLDAATLDSIDRAEDQIASGQGHRWDDVRQKVRDRFLGR